MSSLSTSDRRPDSSAIDEPLIYQGQFGEYTITESDRQGVLIYRAGLIVAALSFGIGTALVFWQGATPLVLTILSFLYAVFSVGLGVSLWTIHIYLVPLHRLLQAFWVVGSLAAIAIAFTFPDPLALTVYQQPQTLWGIGFTFASLTGIAFKEAFCFNRSETKLLTPLIPILLLGHLTQLLTLQAEQVLLGVWAVLLVVFALRKMNQAIPADIGDKSVFDYLNRKQPLRQSKAENLSSH